MVDLQCKWSSFLCCCGWVVFVILCVSAVVVLCVCVLLFCVFCCCFLGVQYSSNTPVYSHGLKVASTTWWFYVPGPSSSATVFL